MLPQFQPGGGIERVVMNYFDYLDHDQYRFDIVTHKMESRTYADEIIAAGGHVHLFSPPGIGTMKANARRFAEILDEGHYDVVHCHMANAAFIYLKIAQQKGVPIRILHSHQDHYADTKLHALRNIPLINIGKRYANRRVACSVESGRFLFGSKPFTVVNNGIDLDVFRFDANLRNEKRKRLKVQESTLLLGQVGRLVPQKNPLFSIRMFNELLKLRPDARLVFAGDGELREEMEQLAQQFGIAERVQFLGNINDVVPLYDALDALLMPSLYEGISLSMSEAQGTGLPVFAANTIAPESFATSFAVKLKLEAGPKYWANAIATSLPGMPKDRESGVRQMREHGFDAKECTTIIERVYDS
ncbi:glycosyltransferase [uncultured Bifidobacterium sp.]|uniref:glycosyltransferase n=1 Tax=uncultured Bifidobacterium sp. TaxID=165187 RepID=UPI0025968240|nr:glycosyltransferase [uncultured Bifidobacterium sp.]